MANLVVIEIMPTQFRASHEAAGNWGVYPHNGAERYRCSEDEADQIVSEDPDGYAMVVGGLDPAFYPRHPWCLD